jgi:hypothetical protein
MSESTAAPQRPLLSMSQVLLCGAAIVTLSMGIRHGFGLWLQPITLDRGWTRETFALAMGVQNLAWGVASRSRAHWPTASAHSAFSSPARCCTRPASC